MALTSERAFAERLIGKYEGMKMRRQEALSALLHGAQGSAQYALIEGRAAILRREIADLDGALAILEPGSR